MINLSTKCEECIHKHVCKNLDNPKNMAKQLEDSHFGEDSNNFNIDVSIYCNNYRSLKIERREIMDNYAYHKDEIEKIIRDGRQI